MYFILDSISVACGLWPCLLGSLQELAHTMSVCGLCRILPEHFCVYTKSVHVYLGLLGLFIELFCSDIINII